MIVLECRFKPHKIRQKARKKVSDQLRKMTVQTKRPAEMDFSRISSVRSQKLELRELRLREPKLREPRLQKPRLLELRLRKLRLREPRLRKQFAQEQSYIQ